MKKRIATLGNEVKCKIFVNEEELSNGVKIPEYSFDSIEKPWTRIFKTKSARDKRAEKMENIWGFVFRD